MEVIALPGSPSDLDSVGVKDLVHTREGRFPLVRFMDQPL